MSRRRRRELEGADLSFLDAICCGFGAVLLLFVIARGAQHLAQRGDVDLQIVVCHYDPRPDLGREFVLGHELPMASHQREQDFERALAEGDGHVVGQELATCRQ